MLTKFWRDVNSDLVKPIRIQRSVDAYRNYDGQQAYISGHGRTGTNGQYFLSLLSTILSVLLIMSSHQKLDIEMFD